MFSVIKKSNNRLLPGYKLSFGFTAFYLGFILIIPLMLVFFKTFSISFDKFWNIITDVRVLKAYKLSFGASFIAAVMNSIFGFIVAWSTVRYKFPGRRIIDSLVDLPFALPTAVAGISLTAIFSPTGLLGGFAEKTGIHVVFTPVGVIVALTFVGLPFVVRTLQPVIAELDKENEEAAASLNAGRFTIFLKVILPSLKPAMITGFTLAFARALGEYGSVVFISGNIPMKTEIAPYLIMTKLEQFDVVEASSIAVVMLIVSFLILLVINLIQVRSRKY